MQKNKIDAAIWRIGSEVLNHMASFSVSCHTLFFHDFLSVIEALRFSASSIIFWIIFQSSAS